MVGEFKKFLTQSNALALAIGVIIGAAVGKVVDSIVKDVLMPVIGLLMPGGEWRTAGIVLKTNPDGTPAATIAYGSLFGALIDFLIIAFVIFMIGKAMIKPAPDPPPGAPLKECPECKEMVPVAARRCRACTSPLPA
jgi:large conductance mechanosensitive channel